MTSKRELAMQLESANAMIEYLRAKLCEGDHEYVKTRRSYINAGATVDVEPIFICTRCLKRKVGRF